MRLRVATGIGGHDWNILIVGEIKEMWFRFFFKRIQTADDLDIKPAREQSLKPVCIGSRSFRLILCEQSGQSALAACRQCYQTVSATFQTDRKSVGSGKSVSVRVDLGGSRIIKKKSKAEESVTTA